MGVVVYMLAGVSGPTASSVSSLAATTAMGQVRTMPQVATNARVGAVPAMSGVAATAGAIPAAPMNAQQQLSYEAPVIAPQAQGSMLGNLLMVAAAGAAAAALFLWRTTRSVGAPLANQIINVQLDEKPIAMAATSGSHLRIVQP